MEFNLAQVHEAIADAVPDRDCIIWRDRRLTWRDVTDRSRRLANYLAAQGLGARQERDGLSGHESHQDHLALYLYNGNEYLEGMLGAFKARVAPVNVNYRYVAEELRYLLENSRARAILYHGAFAPTLAEVLGDLPSLEVLIQVSDDSGHDLLPGAVDYEEALASASPDRPASAPAWSPDDLYILYTGGTTGMPKGVLWRQADIFMSVMGGRQLDQVTEHERLEDVVVTARNGGLKVLPAAPFMHGAGHWIAFLAMNSGHTVVIQDETRRLDPADVLTVVEREKVNFLQIVGDAFGRPILDEMDKGGRDVSSLFIVLSGGAALSEPLKERFLDHLPGAMVIDGMGSSEGGGQGTLVSTKGGPVNTGTFNPSPGSVVVDDSFSRILPAGEEGWLAKRDRVPLGYLGDPEKTAKTFPTVDGVRYSVPGDRARQRDDGVIELLGRDSVTINSGGEKIFAEEVEAALSHHADVYDVVVVGRPSEQWGQEVVAIVQLRAGAVPGGDTERSLLEECSRHVARYKLPKAFVYIEQMQRSPAGKADYRWAKQIAVDAGPAT